MPPKCRIRDISSSGFQSKFKDCKYHSPESPYAFQKSNMQQNCRIESSLGTSRPYCCPYLLRQCALSFPHHIELIQSPRKLRIDLKMARFRSFAAAGSSLSLQGTRLFKFRATVL